MEIVNVRVNHDWNYKKFYKAGTVIQMTNDEYLQCKGGGVDLDIVTVSGSQSTDDKEDAG